MRDNSIVLAKKKKGHKLEWTKTLAVMASKAIAAGGGTSYNILRLSDWSYYEAIVATTLVVSSETFISLNKTFATYNLLAHKKEREFSYKLKMRGKIFYHVSKNIIFLSAGIGFFCSSYTTNHLARLVLGLDSHAPPFYEYHDFRQYIGNGLSLSFSTANIIIYFSKNFKSGLRNVEDFAKYLDENSILDIIKKNKKKLMLAIPVFLGQSACLVFLNMALLPKVLEYYCGETCAASSWINFVKVPIYFIGAYATGINRLPQAFFKEHYEESVNDFKQASVYKHRIGSEVGFTIIMLLLNCGFTTASMVGVISYMLQSFELEPWVTITLATMMALSFNVTNGIFQWKNSAEFFRDLKKWWVNNFYDEDIGNGEENMPKEQEVCQVDDDNNNDQNDEEMDVMEVGSSFIMSRDFKRLNFWENSSSSELNSDDDQSNLNPSFRS